MSRAGAPDGRVAERRPVRDRQIVPRVVGGVLRNSVSGTHGPRRMLLSALWLEMKSFGAHNVKNIELSRVRGIERVVVNGPVVHHGELIVSALAALLECDRVFEFGALDGHLAWLLAHNLEAAQVFAFDVEPPPASPLRGHLAEGLDSPPVTKLWGDSAAFDFSEYSGTIDMVHIDASRRSRWLRSDTDAAFGLLSDLGAIVWYGYAYSPALYAFLNDLAPSLDRPIYHLVGTRLAFYSRWDIVVPSS